MWRIKFLSTPSARRATFAVTAKRRKGNKFLSTPSARRATFWWADVPRICIEFLSTPSARRATEGGEYSRAGEWISIHALREEGDPRGYFLPPGLQISIHALREEGDSPPCAVIFTITEFLSTPSARRATAKTTVSEKLSNIFLSTPSARRATRPARQTPMKTSNFYPRPPRGGRPLTVPTWIG